MTVYADPGVRPRRPPDDPPRRKKKDPVWAKVCIIIGSLVMVVSGAVVVIPKILANWATKDIPQQALVPTELQGRDITGPINMLLLGMDERAGSSDSIRADTIIIVHVPADHRSVYLVSLPRDAEVQIPDYPPTHFRGYLTKINAAFAAGAVRPDGKPDDSAAGRGRGAALTMLTINKLVPGGLTFNGAAIINFVGFRDVLKAIGGVDLCVDIETRSIHYDTAGKYHSSEVPYNSRKVYKIGCQHLDYISALDYARQRHFDEGDYVRQRHQQQLLLAIFKKLASSGTLTNPVKIAALQKVAGNLLTLDLGKIDILDWIFTLKGIDPKNLVMVKTNGGKITPGTIKNNEAFSAESIAMLRAIHDDTLATFLGTHQSWITKDTSTHAAS